MRCQTCMMLGYLALLIAGFVGLIAKDKTYEG